ncbi:MAG: NAD(+) synthase [Eubacteriales bacterium]
MNHGFIKVAALSPDLRVADVEYNTRRIIESVKAAAELGVKVLCLPELCVTGYTCGDLFGFRLLAERAENALVRIADETADLPLFFTVGLPYLYKSKLYNVAAAICSGKILGLVPKTHIPSYGEFYERRNFTPWDATCSVEQTRVGGDRPVSIGTHQIFTCTDMPLLKIGIEICEDVWVTSPPSVSLSRKGATLILNLSASDELIGKAEYRRQLISAHSARIVAGYIYADAGTGESTTDMVFSAHNLIAENGSILAESKPFESGTAVSEIDLERMDAERARMTTFENDCREQAVETGFSLPIETTTLTRKIAPRPFVPADGAILRDRCSAIVMMQAQGLAKRIRHIGCRSVIGISGGLDSTLALLVTVKAYDLLGRDRKDILAVTMPGFGTTVRTKSNAGSLCETLGVDFRTVPISDAVRVHFKDIGQDPDKTDVTYENAQARERTQILMDFANKIGGIVIGTGDLSELALGWATYNGDHMSMYAVNASIPKTLVRYLVSYFADTTENPEQRRVLLDILDTPVSPELIPPKENGQIAQVTEDIVGPYDLHDFFLYYLLRFGYKPSKIYRLAKIAWNGVYDDDTILKWLKIFVKRFFAQQFKRSCLPDGPKVGTVTLSPRGDWRMPSDASAALWLSDLDSIKL